VSGEASPYSVRTIEEPAASAEVDTVAAILARHTTLARAFASFLAGLNFKTPPSLTPGAHLLEAAVEESDQARDLLEALNHVYNDVHDGNDAASVRGHILERYIWHRLERKFPYRLAACEVLNPDGQPDSSFKLDAATSQNAPIVGVEAKSSEYALVGGGTRPDPQRREKAKWVIALGENTGGDVVAAFVTWGLEARFRKKLSELVTEAVAETAHVIAHADVANLPGRVAKIAGKPSHPVRQA
jgi:hypothetical protein